VMALLRAGQGFGEALRGDAHAVVHLEQERG
jgi:hypothetical protein